MRSKISVYEKRTSAKTMGIVGITIIVSVIGLLVVPDIIKVTSFIFTKFQ